MIKADLFPGGSRPFFRVAKRRVVPKKVGGIRHPEDAIAKGPAQFHGAGGLHPRAVLRNESAKGTILMASTEGNNWGGGRERRGQCGEAVGGRGGGTAVGDRNEACGSGGRIVRGTEVL